MPSFQPIFFKIAIGVFCFSMFACKNENKSEDSKEVAEEFNKAKFKKSKEAEFMVNAAGLCYKEIELARLASSNAANQNVKEIAKMMEKDHSKFLTELKELALKKQVTLPEIITEEGQNARTRLADKKGSEFDKQYCEMTVDNHKDAIRDFINATEDCEDAEVKNWATQTLVPLRSHLDYAMTCREAYKNTSQPEDRAFKKDSLKEMDKKRIPENTLDTDKSKSTSKENKSDKKKNNDEEKKAAEAEKK